MTKKEELALFAEKAEELITSSYILADVKIVGVLKAIAQSETMLAIFKSCLSGFDYAGAQKKYLVRNKYLSEDIDAKNLDLSAFINKYFYVDGSFSSAYAAFISQMIKPFCSSLEGIMQGVIEGTVQDPVEALTEEEARKVKEKELAEKEEAKEKDMLEKSYGQSLKEIKNLLLLDKTKIKEARADEETKREMLLIVDMLGSVLDGADKDAVDYAFTAYKFCAKSHPILFGGRVKKIEKLLKDVVREL